MHSYSLNYSLWHTNKHPNVSRRRINEKLIFLGRCFDEWKLKINYTKTVYSVYILSSQVSKQKQVIKIQRQLEKDKNPLYLGLKFDTRLTLKDQLKDIKKKANFITMACASFQVHSDPSPQQHVKSTPTLNQCI